MKMIAAAACFALSIAPLTGALAQSEPTGKAASPEANIRQSEQYDRMLRNSSNFRAQRSAAECGPIEDATLKQQCLDSFGAGNASGGSGMGMHGDMKAGKGMMGN